MINFRIFIISILISIVFTFIIYNVVDWLVYKDIKKCFYNYRDEIFKAAFSKRFAISKIAVEIIDCIDKSILLKAKYRALFEEVYTILEQLPYE